MTNRRICSTSSQFDLCDRGNVSDGDSGAEAGGGTSHARWWLVGSVLVVVAALATAFALQGSHRHVSGAAAVVTSPAVVPSGAPSALPTAHDPAPTPSATMPPPVTPGPVPTQTVPVAPLGTAPAVAGSGAQGVSPGGGVQVKLLSLTPMTTSGVGVGEYSGPGLAVTIEVSGAPAAGLDLSAASVSVNTGTDGTPASPVLTDPRNVSLPPKLAAGQDVRATYIVRAPTAAGTPVAVQVLLNLDLPAVVLQATVS